MAASPASAAGTPDLQLTGVSSSDPLYGEPGSFSSTATLATGQPNGFNLTYRVLLPAGISYDGGAAVPPRVINNAPIPGQTTLLFENVSDIFADSQQGLGFDVAHDPAILDVGDVYSIEIGAYVNSDPRFVPSFNASGIPNPTSFTGSDTATAEATILAIILEKDEPSEEGEIIRGVHDNQTIYTLTLTNNSINPTSGTTITDFLPAGLEFLGCSTNSDNTTDAPTNPGSPNEYVGSGPIVVQPVNDCFDPALVDTLLTDPDGAGPAPSAIYTQVNWNTGTLSPGQELIYRYRAAVPLVENTLTWSGTTPTPASGEQAVNLDNNSGPEIRDEQALTNYAFAAGTYEGDRGDLAVESDTELTRTAEDLAVTKSVNDSVLGQGNISEWNLHFRTSEYRYSEDIVVTDTLPSGLCPLGPTNYTTQNDPSDAECDPTGDNPSAPYTSVTENADGTFTIVWDSTALASLGLTGINDDFNITFPTKTRIFYQNNFLPTTEILAEDSISNSVSLTADAFSRCTAPGTPNCSTPGPTIPGDAGQPEPVVDESSAGQKAPGVQIKKEVSQSGTNCLTATYVNTIPQYRPGDQVCWRLTIDFAGDVDTDPLTAYDFLPPESEYVPGSSQDTAANTTVNVVDDSLAASQLLSWSIAGPIPGSVPSGGQKFQVVFATTDVPDGIISPVDIAGNLFKFGFKNTLGQTFPLRDRAEYETIRPVVDIVKGVRQVNSGPIQNPPVDGLTVNGGDTVTYQVDVSSDEDDALNVEVWDRLPAEFDCTAVSAISNGGICVDGGPNRDVIQWTLPSIPDGSSVALTYQVLIPTTFGPNNTFVNESGVREFQTETNTGGFFTYTPQNNIDPDNPDTPNVPRIDDPSNVRTPNVGVAKSRTTSITETGNTNAQATIGEIVNYTITTTLPAGTTLGTSPRLIDTPPSAATQPIVGTPTALLNGNPLPAGWSINTVGQTVTVVVPDNYAIPVLADDVLTVQIATRILDTPTNTNRRGQNRTNQATFSWTDGGPRSVNSNQVTTTIVEPDISQTKSNDAGPNRVAPGATVNFTVTTRNSNSSNVSIAHDTVIVDNVPVGLTPVDGVGDPIPDGGAVPGTGGALWDQGARTITSSPVSINPNSSVVWNYAAKVDAPAVGGDILTNTADATTTSINGVDPDERTATSTYNVGYVADSTSSVDVISFGGTKTADPAWATIGTQVTYTVVGTIPANLDLFNATVVDVLPDSLDFDGYVSATCIAGCPADPAPTVQTYNPVVTPTSTTIAWDLGNIAAGTGERTIEFVYQAHVRDTYRDSGDPVVAGDDIVNGVQARTNFTDKYVFDPDSLPPASSYDFVGPIVTQTIPVREPDVSLDKQISVNGGPFVDGPRQIQPGDALEYRINLTNNGTSAAYDLAVDDLPDSEITNVVLNQGAAFNTKMWTSGDPSMEWLIPGPLAPGDTATLTYAAESLPSADLATGSSATNTAGSDYFGIPEAERTNPWTYREYQTNEDTVTVNFEFPELEVTKTTTAAGFPDIADANVGQSFGWRVVVRNTATTAVAFDTVVGDTLPPAWTYDAGSTTITGATTAEPGVVTDPGGDVLTWDFAGQQIQPGGTVTITFTATPGPGAKANPPVQTNSVLAVTDDASGSPGNLDGPYTDSDDAQATLLFPVLTVEKTPDDGALNAGDPLNWSIVISNSGTGAASDVDVEDDLQAGMIYTAGTATAVPAAGFTEVSVTPDPNDGSTPIETVWNIASIPAGNSVTITFPVDSLPSLPDGTEIINTVDVTALEQPDPVSDTGNVITGLSADLAASKSVDPDPPTAGSQFTYTIGVENLGPSDATGVTLTDPLPAETSFVSAPGCSEAAGTVTCFVGDLDFGDTAEFEVTVALAPDAGFVTNTVTVSGTTPDPNPDNDTATVDFDADQNADMAIVKTADPGSINQGQTTVFTLLVENRGPSVAENVTVIDPLPAGLEYVSDDSGCSESSGDIECLLGDFQPGQTQTILVTVRGIDTGVWTNTATVGSDTPDDDPLNNESSDDVTVGATADLVITKSAPATATSYQQFTYTMLVENRGPSDATGVTITDPLPPGLIFISSADCDATMSCSLGTILSGDSRTVEVLVETTEPLAGTTVVNTAEVTGNEFDPNPDDNTSTAETVIGTLADIAVVKTGPVQAQADTRIIWNVVVSNSGPNPAENVTLTDTLPPEVTNPSVTTSQGTCDTTIACSFGTIPVDGTVTLTIEADIPRDTVVGSTILNSVVVATTTDETNLDNNTSSWETEITAPTPFPADVGINKERSNNDKVEVGDIVVFRLTATNFGEVAADNVVITDTLSPKLRFRRASIPGGKCTFKAPTVTCRVSSLAGGASVTARVRVRVIDIGRVVNTATINADNSIISIPTSTTRFPVSKGSTNLQVTKKAGRKKVKGGGKVGYRITVRNRTDRAATGVTVCDQIPAGTTVVRIGRGRLDAGRVCWDIPYLGGGVSRSFAITLRVDSLYRGKAVRNTAVARAENVSGKRQDSAKIGVIEIKNTRGGGVTG